MLRCHEVVAPHDGLVPAGVVTLGYEDRFLRRKPLTSDTGLTFMLDLPRAQELPVGHLLRLEDGVYIRIAAADEPLVAIRHPQLARIAWHIGNRHTPCEIADDQLMIRRDHVIEEMLAQQGATLTIVQAPFQPEGGAYGVGRTHGHHHD